MPPTTVQKMIGPTIIAHQLDEAVAERLHRRAGCGKTLAQATPMIVATST